MSSYDFSGKVAFVSGAGRGFGRRVSELLAQGGAKLVVTDFSDELVNGTVEAISATGADIRGLSGDIADEKTSRKCAALIGETHGGLDIAINNAGIAQPHTRLHEMDSSFAEKIVAVDLMGVFYAMKHQIPLMLKRAEEGAGPCTILNVSSAAARLGSPHEFIDYAASKGAIDTFTLGLAREYGERGIRVNAVRPGIIRTSIHASAGAPDRVERLGPQVPLGRAGEVDEVARTILWLLSDEASYVTGALVDVAGGR